MIIRMIFIIFSLSLLTACSSTTVVLVPDAGGKVGQVTLTTEAGSTVISKAYDSAEATNSKKAPTKPDQLGKSNTQDMFSENLAIEPKAPKRYALYFATGSAELSPNTTETDINQITTEIQSRKFCDVSVIGHTDRVWDNENNMILSLKRANTVRETLGKNGLNILCMDIRYYGENDPAVPTQDEVAEPLNRRVVVEIR